jgi:integrase
MATLFRRSNGVYYVVQVRKGKRCWRSTGTTSRIDALKKLKRLSFDPVEPTPARVTLAQFAETFFPYAQANLAPATVTLYRAALKSFTRIIPKGALGSVSSLDMERFKAARLKEVSPSKVNIDFACLKAFFEKAVTWNYLESNPCKGVKLIKIPPRRPVFLTEGEFGRLLATVDEPWFKELLVFAVSTMMRAGEIVNLTWTSVDMIRKVIMVENTNEHRLKTTQPHGVPMNDLVFAMLDKRKERSGLVFRNGKGERLQVNHLTHKFKRHVKRSQLSDELHFHSLRHTGASWLVQGGVSIYAVQRLLGHSDIKVTMIYSHLVTSEMHESVNTIRLNSIFHSDSNVLSDER